MEQFNTLIGPNALSVNILEISAAGLFFPLIITVSLELELSRQSAGRVEKSARKPNGDEHAENEHERSHRKQGHNTAEGFPLDPTQNTTCS